MMESYLQNIQISVKLSEQSDYKLIKYGIPQDYIRSYIVHKTHFVPFTSYQNYLIRYTKLKPNTNLIEMNNKS